MKTIHKFLLLVLPVLLFSACVDLDTEPQSATVTENQKKTTANIQPEKAMASVNAIFSRMNAYEAYFEDWHNDFGFPSAMLTMETNGFDCVSENINYNWFSYELTYQNRLENDGDNLIFWNTMYALIHNCNSVAALSDSATTDSTLQFYLAQAYAVRAMCYYTLAENYQFTYKGNETKACVPIITEKNMSSVGSSGCPRATVQQVYDQIIRDLNNAVNLLNKTTLVRSDKRYVSLEVAYGLRARAELTMQNWTAAKSDAKLAQKGYTPLSMTAAAKPGFNDASASNWMWADILAETDRVVTSGLANFGGHMCSLSSEGYASAGGWRKINKALFDQIDTSDVRKGWWIDGDGVSANLTKAQAGFLTSKSAEPYTNVKYGPYENDMTTSLNAAPIPLMRVEEMILIEAEATAMAGDPTGGAQILENFVKTYRDPKYTCTATVAELVQEAVYLQRRIELWGEGLNWFDVKRLKKNMDRRGAYYKSADVIFNIPATSNQMISRIPESEITNNVQIPESDNNPAVQLPQAVQDIDY